MTGRELWRLQYELHKANPSKYRHPNEKGMPLEFESSVSETLSEIEALQSEFTRTRSPRKQYRLLKATEPLFARLGIVFPPLTIETMRGPYAWWVRGGRRG